LPAVEQASGVEEIAAELEAAVRAAGALALGKFRSQFKSWTKGAASSPVSEVDIAVDDLLRERLGRVDPRYGWLSEETTDDPARCEVDRVWIVDPIDGTRAFIAGRTDWAVSAALVERGRPIVAALFAPAEEAMYLAAAGGGATREGMALTAHDAASLDGARVSGPKSYVEPLTAAAPIEVLPRVHSLALRLTRVADGTLDMAFAGGNSHDWDIAAADLIVHEAGGLLTGLDGKAVVYNRRDPVHSVLVAAGRGRHERFMALVRERRVPVP
jgi:myo-inositol-1(or 4)-monophosphatase